MALTALAAVTLGLGMLGSLVYELWRVMARAGISEYDTRRRFVREELPFYAIGALVVVALLVDWEFASVAGLAFAIVIVAYSVFRYMPRIYPARKPGLVDDLA